MEQQRMTMQPQRFAPSPSNTPSSASFARDARPAANIASREASQDAAAPLSGFKDPFIDPIFFTDPRFKFEVNNYWGNPLGSNQYGFTGSSASGYNINASYNTPNDFIPRYKPTDDDLQVYQRYGERAAKEKEDDDKGETERGLREKALQQFLYQLELLRKE
jgi:hypothetical protein